MMHESLEKHLESRLNAAVQAELNSFISLARTVADTDKRHTIPKPSVECYDALTDSFRAHADHWLNHTISQGIETAAVILSLSAETLSAHAFLRQQPHDADEQDGCKALPPSTTPQSPEGTNDQEGPNLTSNGTPPQKQLLGGFEVPKQRLANNGVNGRRRGGPLNRRSTIKFLLAHGFTRIRSANDDVYKHAKSKRTIVLPAFHGGKTEIPEGEATKICRQLSAILGIKLLILSGGLSRIEATN
jgi:predicted RNA binding protein YcfA (HicA-like mRNA interferase family)